eukprot:gene48484-60165_t
MREAGRLRMQLDLQQQSRRYEGLAQGFTSVVPHRWARPALSQSLVECFELPRAELTAFLRDQALLRPYVQWVRRLMWPRAVGRQDAAEARAAAAHLRTPAMYPVSDT